MLLYLGNRAILPTRERVSTAALHPKPYRYVMLPAHFEPLFLSFHPLPGYSWPAPSSCSRACWPTGRSLRHPPQGGPAKRRLRRDELTGAALRVPRKPPLHQFPRRGIDIRQRLRFAVLRKLPAEIIESLDNFQFAPERERAELLRIQALYIFRQIVSSFIQKQKSAWL